MVTSFYHYTGVTDRRAADVRLFVFYLSLGLVRVCEIKLSHVLSHMVKTTVIPIWCARNISDFTSAQSDQCLCYPHEESFGPKLYIERTANAHSGKSGTIR